MDLWAKWSPASHANVRCEWSPLPEVFKMWLDSPSRLEVWTPHAVWSSGGKESSHFWCQTDLILAWVNDPDGFLTCPKSPKCLAGKGHVEGNLIFVTHIIQFVNTKMWVPFSCEHVVSYMSWVSHGAPYLTGNVTHNNRNCECCSWCQYLDTPPLFIHILFPLQINSICVTLPCFS